MKERTYHVVRLVVDPEDDLGVVDEAASKLGPEFLELLGSSGVGVASVSDDLLRGYTLKGGYGEGL